MVAQATPRPPPAAPVRGRTIVVSIAATPCPAAHPDRSLPSLRWPGGWYRAVTRSPCCWPCALTMRRPGPPRRSAAPRPPRSRRRAGAVYRAGFAVMIGRQLMAAASLVFASPRRGLLTPHLRWFPWPGRVSCSVCPPGRCPWRHDRRRWRGAHPSIRRWPSARRPALPAVRPDRIINRTQRLGPADLAAGGGYAGSPSCWAALAGTRPGGGRGALPAPPLQPFAVAPSRLSTAASRRARRRPGIEGSGPAAAVGGVSAGAGMRQRVAAP